MSKRPKFEMAMLGLAVAFTAALLGACGSNDSATNGGATKPSDFATLDVNDENSVAVLAKEYGIDVQPFVKPGAERGGGEDTVADLMFPSGSVRKEGLRQYRIDVGGAYHGDGTLQFRHGAKVLWKGDSLFNPVRSPVISDVPRSVVDAVKVNDEITWGIFFEDKRKPVKTTFHVIDKPQVSKKLAEMAADKKFKKQPDVLKDLVKAQLFQSYSLHTEALQAFLDIEFKNPDFAQVHQGIVTSLLRLDLKDSDLFSREIGKVTPVKGPGSPARIVTDPAPIAVTPPPPANLPKVDPAKAPTGDTGGKFERHGPVGATGGDPTPKPTPDDGTSKPIGPVVLPPDSPTNPQDGIAAAQALARATDEAKLASDDAKRLQDQATHSQEALDVARKNADAANAAVDAARAALAADPSDTTKADDLTKAMAALQAANDLLAQAQLNADQAAKAAADAQKRADEAARLLAQLQAVGQSPAGQVPADVAAHTQELVTLANDAAKRVDQLVANAPAADKALVAAMQVVAQDRAAFEAAKAAFEADPTDDGKRAAFEAAQQALMAAQQAADAALKVVTARPDGAALSQALSALEAAKKDLKAAQTSPTANTPQGATAIQGAALKVSEAAKLVEGLLLK